MSNPHLPAGVRHRPSGQKQEECWHQHLDNADNRHGSGDTYDPLSAGLVAAGSLAGHRLPERTEVLHRPPIGDIFQVIHTTAGIRKVHSAARDMKISCGRVCLPSLRRTLRICLKIFLWEGLIHGLFRRAVSKESSVSLVSCAIFSLCIQAK